MKIVSVVGARPQFIKAAAVSRALAKAPDMAEIIVHTGQHFDPDMSDIFFEELAIPAPRRHLGVHGGGHGEMTGRMMIAVEAVLAAEHPAWTIVYGDTNSTLAAALAAAKLNIPVAHVEAGLRSFNRRMPEEINRVAADHVSTLLLCPTQAALANLAREGIVRGVHHVGDVMYDATLHAREQARTRSKIIERLGVQPNGYYLATVHRAENTDEPAQLARIVAWLQERAAKAPVILPLHPRTREAAARAGIGLTGLRICPPVGYLDMACLLDGARAVFTDSGGLQKEAYFHRRPCVTLRNETEWVETVEAGWNRLWTVADYAPRREIPDYGDGEAAEKIVALLRGGR
ncbi:MAG TPA: UDP-N-acetylglucosamine 2-epimerase (non-hydrolyzing) [Alphaproteobacteria bacterium]|nr:UDP-N-acetylglucosamine 2-epimerase (non-hydrolyzing) [Alphaproteobacteria bacterium]